MSVAGQDVLDLLFFLCVVAGASQIAHPVPLLVQFTSESTLD